MHKLFILLIGLSFGAIAVTPDPTAMGVKTTTSSFKTTPMVPKYNKPALPPEQTEAEIAEEDPTKQAIKNTAIAGGVLLGSNLLLKGFSNKYMKEACLSQNTVYEFSKTKDSKEIGAKSNYYYTWDTKFSLKADETEKCITCCPKTEKFADIKTDRKTLEENEKKQKEAEERCKEHPTDSEEYKDCMKLIEQASASAINCITSATKCGEDIYTKQMYQHCNKKKFRGVTPCPSEK